MKIRLHTVALTLLALVGIPASAEAQHYAMRGPLEASVDTTSVSPEPVPDTLTSFTGRRDSLMSVRTRRAALKARALHIVVSVTARQLWVVDGRDTLYRAQVAVGMAKKLEYGGRRWTFETPPGVRSILGKKEEPLWSPPDWHYAEVAREYGLRMVNMPAKGITLGDGRKLVVRDSLVGFMLPDGFAPLPADEHIVFDSTLYVPPLGTKNRFVDGELGRYMLDMGNGYRLHGTPREQTIGSCGLSTARTRSTRRPSPWAWGAGSSTAGGRGPSRRHPACARSSARRRSRSGVHPTGTMQRWPASTGCGL